ncbi:MAG: MarR family transcriptional regulator [Gemmatimonadales bacterium]
MNDTVSAQADRTSALVPLLEAARVVEERLERALGTIGLSKSKLICLTRLVEAEESLPLSVLAERCSCVRSNVTQLVDRLEDEGLVRRINDPADRRSVRAELTRQGRDAQVQGDKLFRAEEVRVAAELSPTVRAALSALAASRE